MSYEPDDDVKEKKLVTLNAEVIPFYLEKLEDIARDNNGYLALGRVDFLNYFLCLLNRLRILKGFESYLPLILFKKII